MNATSGFFSSAVSFNSSTRLKDSAVSSSVKSRTSWREGGDSLIPRSVKVLSGPCAAARPLNEGAASHTRVLAEVIGANEELLRRLGPRGIHVSISTVAPETSRRLAEGHKYDGVTYLAAPGPGRPGAAAAAKLWIFRSGPAEAKER